MADQATFLTQYPEFTKANTNFPGLIAGRLQSAINGVDPTVWGARADDGIYALTAHKLCLSPFGQSAKMKINEGGGTSYLIDYKRMLLEVAGAAALLV